MADSIPPLKPGKDIAQHVKSIEREINNINKWLHSEHTDEEIRQKCTWIMKRLLRSGFELVMERSQKYTRDLYPCYEGFSEYYPDKKGEMYLVLELAINPTTEKTEIINILNGIGNWIVEEIKQVF